jgi:ABC-type hemin transport system substrate-binding protein
MSLVKLQMKNEWLVVTEQKAVSGHAVEINVKLQSIVSQIDEGKGWRYTEEQAETLTKLVNKLVKQVKAETKRRNDEHKSFFKLPFFKVKVSINH